MICENDQESDNFKWTFFWWSAVRQLKLARMGAGGGFSKEPPTISAIFREEIGHFSRLPLSA